MAWGRAVTCREKGSWHTIGLKYFAASCTLRHDPQAFKNSLCSLKEPFKKYVTGLGGEGHAK